MYDAAAYRDQLVALLPPGRAWNRDPDGVLGRLLGGFAEELARVDRRAIDLHDEADPRTALELLTDWERVAALPDACAGAPDALAERQVALASKIASRGGQSIPFFTALAEQLGYAVTINEFTSCDAGFAAGAEVCADGWRHAWTVEIVIGTAEAASTGSEFNVGSVAGDRLVGFGSLNLECLIERARPAHTHVLFTYFIEPDPAFWFDFTGD